MTNEVISIDASEKDVEIMKNAVRGILKQVDIDHVTAVIMLCQSAKIFYSYIINSGINEDFNKFYRENIPERDRCLDLFTVINNQLDKMGEEVFKNKG